MDLYCSDTIGNHRATIFPHQVSVDSKEKLEQAAAYDHVAADYENNYRSVGNFKVSNVVVLDLDNDHSDNSEDWIEMSDFTTYFQDVTCYLVASRNHQKSKGSLSARPRFHVYFPIEEVYDAQDYKQLKESIVDYFPYFDRNALDSARMIFGVANPEIVHCAGNQKVCSFIRQVPSFETWNHEQSLIPEGSRNSTMSHYAGRLLIRLGNTKEAREQFNQKALDCSPPLSEEELNKIWQSALNFGERVSQDPNYIPPDQFNVTYQYKPTDYSDVGQASVLAEHFSHQLCYSPSTDFLVYNGSYWDESKSQAVGVVKELTNKQLEEAGNKINEYRQLLENNGGMQLLTSMSKKKAQEAMTKDQAVVMRNLEDALAYEDFVLRRRDNRYIQSALNVVRHLVEIEQGELDQGEFLLNTPSYTIDLKTGEILAHRPEDLITKQTLVDVSDKGKKHWLDALNTFFQEDQELIDYVQKIVGLAAIGKVYVEALIIAYGDGRNGKSTFWNVIAKVLGSYSGNLSADSLTMKQQGNVKYELAEAKGKRLLISAELQEGMRLNTSVVKKLCSTDEIFAEKKFKDPFSYTPSHTLVLYTNHLPKVGALDEGTWRRLIVIPFEAKIEGNSDIKNYADFLYQEAGEAILAWVVEGAQKVIAEDYKISQPQKVKDAVAFYKETNDWFHHFIMDCCDVKEGLIEKSGRVYEEYRAYCHRSGEFPRSTTDFYTALASAGFERKKTNRGSFIHGLKLQSEFL
ncbi:phage/plasmid primase, P4 family [Fundicoccus sp. Sow4_H7]|uniref:phage/plasmid primase, P4 family n=1 Tax=Lactobacillales TaxID=186826 RepID=UPI00237DDF3B|nr:phage/plasmid primase, P4 family [Jeotgalibaca caeni]MDE1547747.1 phage/plasmid primase, P4 family [Jeotgalibaca caeni]